MVIFHGKMLVHQRVGEATSLHPKQMAFQDPPVSEGCCSSSAAIGHRTASILKSDHLVMTNIAYGFHSIDGPCSSMNFDDLHNYTIVIFRSYIR